jgi:twitching motility protein PilT
MAKIDELFRMMKDQKASDLHLTSGVAPFLRLHGEMVKINYRDLSAEDCQALIFEILTEKQKRLFIENWELDCSYHLEGVGRFRVNVFMQRRGIGAVFRIIPEKILTVEELGLPQSLLDMINVHKGLILVTGPTGSGKSTTLAALIHYINVTQRKHIITIEDPIEFVHNNSKSLINQREVSSHTKTFANALRAALREDPDIILVGEMRDLETISLAITAAETGHVVFGTLHTNSASKTVDRVIDVFPETQQEQIRIMLAESLRGVVAQSLLPRADHQGRVAVLEVLFSTHAVANLIREGKTFQIPSAMQTGRSQGMLTFEMSAQESIKKGLLSKADAMSFLGTKSINAEPEKPAVEAKPQQAQQQPKPAQAKPQAVAGGIPLGIPKKPA